MTVFTAEQLQDFRQLTGTECTPQDVGDDVVQRLYDRAFAFGHDESTTEAITVVYLLRRLLGQARIKTDLKREFETEVRSQYFKNIMDMLKYWEGIARAGGFTVSGMGSMSVGMLNLDIDWTEADTDAEWLLE